MDEHWSNIFIEGFFEVSRPLRVHYARTYEREDTCTCRLGRSINLKRSFRENSSTYTYVYTCMYVYMVRNGWQRPSSFSIVMSLLLLVVGRFSILPLSSISPTSSSGPNFSPRKEYLHFPYNLHERWQKRKEIL